MKVVNTTFDIDVKLVTVEGAIVAIVSNITVEQLDANPDLKRNVEELIRVMIEQYGRYGVMPEKL